MTTGAGAVAVAAGAGTAGKGAGVAAGAEGAPGGGPGGAGCGTECGAAGAGAAWGAGLVPNGLRSQPKPPAGAGLVAGPGADAVGVDAAEVGAGADGVGVDAVPAGDGKAAGSLNTPAGGAMGTGFAAAGAPPAVSAPGAAGGMAVGVAGAGGVSGAVGAGAFGAGAGAVSGPAGSAPGQGVPAATRSPTGGSAGAGDGGTSATGVASAGAGFFLKKLNIGGFLESLHSMKRAFTLLGLLACLSATAAPPGSAVVSSTASAAPAPGRVGAPAAAALAPAVASGARQFTLSNGMQLLVQPDRRAPTAVHMLWVRVGSMDEVDGTSGVAHVLEHMMFKGTKTLPPGEFSRRVAALGGRENAFTSRDYTGYYQQIPANRLEDVMKIEADRFANNHWPDEEFRKEIEVVKEERRLRTEDQPRAMLAEQLFASTFIASPYRRPIVGWMSDLDAMTPDDVRAFHRKWYTPSNAAVVVAGDVDVDRVRALAEKYYGAIPARAVPERKPRAEPPQRGLRRIEVKAPAEQAYVALAFHVPGLDRVENLTDADRDALSLMVLSAVFSGYDGARLERALSQGEQRVADSASSSAMVTGRGPALFLLTGVPAAGRTAAQVEQALRAEVARVARDGVSEAELARVKTQWIASTVYERDSVQSQAQELGGNWAQGYPLDGQERLLALLREVTPAQVQAVAARYFGDDQLTVATLLPQPLDAPRPARPAPAAGAMRH